MPRPGFVTSVQDQGPRHDQEDFIVHIPFDLPGRRGHLIGVLDGHGGRFVAENGAWLIAKHFDPSVKDASHELRRLVHVLHERSQFRNEGSTVSLAHINETENSAVTAVLGDSPIIVIDARKKVTMSEAHNVRCNKAEREAVLRRGGVYDGDTGYVHNARGNRWNLPSDEGTQLSRAIGDRVLRNILGSKPTICNYKLGRKSAVLVASDGIYDAGNEMGSDFDTKELASLMSRGGPADTILAWRKQRKLEDNTSAILWRPWRWRDYFF